MTELVVVHGVGRREREGVHGATYASGVVYVCRAVSLCLQIAVIAEREVEAVGYACGYESRIDKASRGIELLVGEIVLLGGERGCHRHAAEERGAEAGSDAVIVVGHIVGAERRIVGLYDAIEERGVHAARVDVEVGVAREACHGGVACVEHLVPSCHLAVRHLLRAGVGGEG